MTKSKSSEFSEYLKDNYPVNVASISNRKSLFGVGLNDSNYRTHPRVNGKQISCPIYSVWCSMLCRVYYENKLKLQPAYKDVTVCGEWLNFSNFREWFIENHVDGWQMDKDLLVVGNKVYSPDTCVFVPQWLNSFTISSNSSRGQYLIGVSWDSVKRKFMARCSHPKTKKQQNLGTFYNEEQAYLVWLNRKLEIALELKPEMEDIDLRIYPNVVEIIKNSK